MLLKFDCAVFAHGDIAPRNIMIDEKGNITGIIDWEYAGWYPDHWEYAQIMRPASWGDWPIWMERKWYQCFSQSSVLDDIAKMLWGCMLTYVDNASGFLHSAL